MFKLRNNLNRAAGLVMVWLATALAAPAFSQTNLAAQNDDRPEAMLVMDFSGSMWGSVNGEAKFEILNDIVERNFDEWNNSLNLGVLAYGHRRKSDCRDIELAFTPGEARSSTIRNWVTRQRPVGKTPLGNSLVTAASYFNSKGQDANLIVLSDGIESCGVDPCRIIRELQSEGAKMTAHVIGFNLNARDANEIRCIADLTGGTYVDANRADQLIDGFRRAVETIAVKDNSAELALRDTLGKSLDALRETTEQLDAANKRVEQAAANLGDAQAEIARLNALLDQRDASIEELEIGLEDCQAELARLAALLDDAQGTIATQNAALQDAADQNAQLTAQNAQLSDELEQQRRQIALLEDNIGERDSTIVVIRGDLNEAEDSITALESKNSELAAMLEEALRNRQLTVSSLDFGAFSGTTEPVDIAALVAERDSYLSALQTLRQNLGFVLDPLSQAQTIANAIPEEANPVAVPDELNELIVLLSPGVEGELPDLQWILRGKTEDALGIRDAGGGARIPLPDYRGMYEVELKLPGYDVSLMINNDPATPLSRRTDLNIGRLSLSLPGSAAGVFFTTIMDDNGRTVAKLPIETAGTIYLKPGLYTVKAQSETDVDEFEVQIYAGKETAVPLRF